MPEENKTLIALAMVLSFGFLAFIISQSVERKDISVPTEVTRFPEVELEAQSAYVYDLRVEKVLFAKNSEKALPLASLSKLMSALVAEDIYYDYGTVTIPEEALATFGDSGLKPGEKWRLRELLDFSLITSSNDGISAVALTLGGKDFVKAMNKKANDLGLLHTHFNNETGLDEEDKPGSSGSAKDVANLLRHIMLRYPEALEATRFDSAEIPALDGELHLAKNTNSIAHGIPGLLASKTGLTELAGGNLAFIFDPELGRPMIVVVLGSTARGRFRDAEKLVEAVMEYIQ